MMAAKTKNSAPAKPTSLRTTSQAYAAAPSTRVGALERRELKNHEIPIITATNEKENTDLPFTPPASATAITAVKASANKAVVVFIETPNVELTGDGQLYRPASSAAALSDGLGDIFGENDGKGISGLAGRIES